MAKQALNTRKTYQQREWQVTGMHKSSPHNTLEESRKEKKHVTGRKRFGTSTNSTLQRLSADLGETCTKQKA